MKVSPSNFTDAKLECRSIDECLGTCEVYSQLRVMTEQEALPAYACADYLVYADAMNGFLAEASSVTSEPIDPECRVRMVEWCFQVIDFDKGDKAFFELNNGDKHTQVITYRKDSLFSRGSFSSIVLSFLI